MHKEITKHKIQDAKPLHRTLHGVMDSHENTSYPDGMNHDARVCPKCGAVNESDSMFCEHCGSKLQDSLCPNCGALMPDNVDYCEKCNTYIDDLHCSFCHADLRAEEEYCPECGAPRSGIECPVCHTIGHFGFCEMCGSPLTDSARSVQKSVWEKNPSADDIRQLEDELERLWLIRPVTTDRQREVIKSVQQLCDRVKQLMAQEGQNPYAQKEGSGKQEEMACIEENELKNMILEKQQALQNLLDQMKTSQVENPATARNYAMAGKPHVSRLAWKCNYKHALHLSPLACACPQMGGKWVVTDGQRV